MAGMPPLTVCVAISNTLYPNPANKLLSREYYNVQHIMEADLSTKQ